MTQSEYEPIHSAQVKRDKEKLVRLGNVLAPSNTTQFLIRDHNRQTTPSSSSSATTPISTDIQDESSSSTSHQLQHQPSLTYDQMFEMGDVDAQSDDTESGQDGLGVIDHSLDDDFNDIYYQCRYERYAAFSRVALLKEVMSLCSNIDRLQHEKSEVEKRLRDVQQHLYMLNTGPTSSNDGQETVTTEEGTTTNNRNVDRSRVKSPQLHEQPPPPPPPLQQQQSYSSDGGETTPLVDEQSRPQTPPLSSSAQLITTEQQEIVEPTGEVTVSMENDESEQQIVIN